LLHRVFRLVFRFTRPRRMAAFVSWAGLSSSTRVLDVGGTGFNWDVCRVVPELTLLNLAATRSGQREVVGSGTDLPFRDGAFDIVFSNSVIEHVADHDAFARELRRVGHRYFVQTPNRRFPFEPHVLTPAVNYLPKRFQQRIYRNFTLWGWIVRPSAEEVAQFVSETNLLDRREMKRLFADGEVVGLRSLIARDRAVVEPTISQR
jgi:SAM-dependent methyltransferase